MLITFRLRHQFSTLRCSTFLRICLLLHVLHFHSPLFRLQPPSRWCMVVPQTSESQSFIATPPKLARHQRADQGASTSSSEFFGAAEAGVFSRMRRYEFLEPAMDSFTCPSFAFLAQAPPTPSSWNGIEPGKPATDLRTAPTERPSSSGRPLSRTSATKDTGTPLLRLEARSSNATACTVERPSEAPQEHPPVTAPKFGGRYGPLYNYNEYIYIYSISTKSFGRVEAAAGDR